MTGAVEQVAATRRIEIKENARNDNDLLLQASLEEVKPVGNGVR